MESHSALQRVSNTYPISQAGIGSDTVFTPDGDKRFVVTKFYIYAHVNVGVEGAYRFLSGAVALSGDIETHDHNVIQDGTGNEIVFIGRANGEAFIVECVDNLDLLGYAVIAQMQGT